MPEAAAEIITQWIKHYGCKFKVAKTRVTKFGDYRAPDTINPYHRISVNGDLNPYAFLVTVVHEFAHLQTYISFKSVRIKPHGKEWKFIFRQMMQPFFDQKIFPEDIARELVRYLNNPAASSCTDKKLYQVLLGYNKEVASATYISQIDEGDFFIFRNRIFKKGAKRRTRYSCLEMESRKIYLFSSLAEVAPLT